jgi:hypothetical protein
MAKDYVVGLQERLERSMRLFTRELRWRRVFLPRANVGRERELADRLSPRAREAILARNQRDLALHEHFSRELDRVTRRSVWLLGALRPRAGPSSRAEL